MRILHVTPSYFPVIGGSEKRVQEVSERLAQRGHQVTVFTVNASKEPDLGKGNFGGLPEDEIINSVRVKRFRPNNGTPVRLLNKWLRLKGGYRSLSLLLRKEGVERLSASPQVLSMIPSIVRFEADIVTTINWYWPPAYYGYLARKMRRFTLVGIPLFHTAGAWCNRAIYSRMLAECDAVMVNTAHEGWFVNERASTRVEEVGGGTNPELFEGSEANDVRIRYGLGKHPVIGFVGRQVPNKGALKLLQAMRTVWKWNADVRVVFAGPRAHRHHEVESEIGCLTPSQQERIVSIDDFPEAEKPLIFAAFDVFALPSTEESFGNAYLEAWLCRKPVIGARIGSTQCVIDDGVDGLLVDPNDSEDIARTLIQLLSNKSLRDRMGQNGHAKTIRRYTWDKITHRFETLYSELVAGKNSKNTLS